MICFFHTYYYYCFSFFFFLMIRRPPRSTLFPTRRSSDPPGGTRLRRWPRRNRLPEPSPCGLRAGRGPRRRRSEEHTSELQSPCNLVCRLLLEKKKKNKIKILYNNNKYVRQSLIRSLNGRC